MSQDAKSSQREAGFWAFAAVWGTEARFTVSSDTSQERSTKWHSQLSDVKGGSRRAIALLANFIKVDKEIYCVSQILKYKNCDLGTQIFCNFLCVFEDLHVLHVFFETHDLGTQIFSSVKHARK